MVQDRGELAVLLLRGAGEPFGADQLSDQLRIDRQAVRMSFDGAAIRPEPLTRAGAASCRRSAAGDGCESPSSAAGACCRALNFGAGANGPRPGARFAGVRFAGETGDGAAGGAATGTCARATGAAAMGVATTAGGGGGASILRLAR